MKKNMLAGALTLALVVGFAALRAEEAKTKTAAAKPAPEAQGPVYMAACPSPCDFAVSSHDKKEVAAVIKEHAKSHHHMDMADKDVEGMVKEQGAKK